MVEVMMWGRPHVLHAAWAERAAGPGWNNPLYWAIVSPVEGKRAGQLEKLSIQPDGMSPELRTLFQVSAEVHLSVLSAMAKQIQKKFQ